MSHSTVTTVHNVTFQGHHIAYCYIPRSPQCILLHSTVTTVHTVTFHGQHGANCSIPRLPQCILLHSMVTTVHTVTFHDQHSAYCYIPRSPQCIMLHSKVTTVHTVTFHCHHSAYCYIPRSPQCILLHSTVTTLHTVTFHGHHSAYYLSSYWPGFCILVWKYFPHRPRRVLRRIFGAKRDEVTGEWSKLQIKQDYFPEDRNAKHSKAMKCNQYSATKSLPSPFRKSANIMTVLI